MYTRYTLLFLCLCMMLVCFGIDFIHFIKLTKTDHFIYHVRMGCFNAPLQF